MIKGIIFDLDDTLTIHDELYDISYLKVVEKFLPNSKIDSIKILKIFINTIHKIGTEKLFLKVLIQGEASLFKYKDKSLTRYFYQTSHLDINQLIFKEYKTPENKIGTNNEFRRQLYNNIKCIDISMNNLKQIDYDKNSLLNIFTKYNSCKNSAFVNFEEKVK